MAFHPLSDHQPIDTPTLASFARTDSYRKQVMIDEEVALLDVLDTAGQEEYSYVPPRQPPAAGGIGADRNSVVHAARCASSTCAPARDSFWSTRSRPGARSTRLAPSTSRSSVRRHPPPSLPSLPHADPLDSLPRAGVKDKDAFPVIVVANKIDMEYERQVGAHEGREWAAHTGCQYIETSAKNRINVDEAFTSLVREIRKFNQVSTDRR
jgi:GTPase KRas protein